MARQSGWVRPRSPSLTASDRSWRRIAAPISAPNLGHDLPGEAAGGLSGAVVVTRCARPVGCRWRDIRLIRRATLCPSGGHRCHAEQRIWRLSGSLIGPSRSTSSRIEGVQSAHVHVWASVIIRRWVTPSKVCRRILLLTSVRACRLGTGQRQEADSDVGEGNVPWPCRWSSVPCAR